MCCVALRPLSERRAASVHRSAHFARLAAEDRREVGFDFIGEA